LEGSGHGIIEILSQISCSYLEKPPNISISIVGVEAEIQSENLFNMSHEIYRYANPLSMIFVLASHVDTISTSTLFGPRHGLGK
jgi:hypothetical protein